MYYILGEFDVMWNNDWTVENCMSCEEDKEMENSNIIQNQRNWISKLRVFRRRSGIHSLLHQSVPGLEHPQGWTECAPRQWALPSLQGLNNYPRCEGNDMVITLLLAVRDSTHKYSSSSPVFPSILCSPVGVNSV